MRLTLPPPVTIAFFPLRSLMIVWSDRGETACTLITRPSLLLLYIKRSIMACVLDGMWLYDAILN